MGEEGKIGERRKECGERDAEDKGDDDYDDDDGTAGYDKFSRFTPACKVLEKVGIYTWKPIRFEA